MYTTAFHDLCHQSTRLRDMSHMTSCCLRYTEGVRGGPQARYNGPNPFVYFGGNKSTFSQMCSLFRGRPQGQELSVLKCLSMAHF